MNHAAMQWAREIPAPARLKAMLLLLASYADSDGGRIFPSVATLAAQLSVTPRSAARQLSDLRRLRLLEIIQTSHGRTPTHYRLALANPDARVIPDVRVIPDTGVRVTLTSHAINPDTGVRVTLTRASSNLKKDKRPPERARARPPDGSLASAQTTQSQNGSSAIPAAPPSVPPITRAEKDAFKSQLRALLNRQSTLHAIEQRLAAGEDTTPQPLLESDAVRERRRQAADLVDRELSRPGSRKALEAKLKQP